jgi:predicted nucleic-acid-binding Zn-ribbon protein
MSSLRDGVCPQCGLERVHSGAVIEGKEGLRGGNRIPINDVIQVALDNYVCVDCGYVESYISDRSILNRIAKEWVKVEPKDSD